jgi:hypothetical protein
MENCRWYKIECVHTIGTPESKRLKVTTLNLFHPTASPPLQKVGFFILRHSLSRGRRVFLRIGYPVALLRGTSLVDKICIDLGPVFHEIFDPDLSVLG